MRRILILPFVCLFVFSACSQHLTTGDQYIQMTLSRKIYSTSEDIQLTFTIIGNPLVLLGPCNSWFEKKTDQGWSRVGECPDTNFTDLPALYHTGDQFTVSMPTSDTDNPYAYRYSLSTGTYRYAVKYWINSSLSAVCYSEGFEIADR